MFAIEQPPSDVLTVQAHPATHVSGDYMQIQTQFLRLRRSVALGDRIDDWRVSWIGGWGRYRVFFIVMVLKERFIVPYGRQESLGPRASPSARVVFTSARPTVIQQERQESHRRPPNSG